jgi:hypothetical protein
MSKTYVPLISSGTAGPLGVLHLPRLWLKVSLEAKGRLADGYPGIGQGFDTMVIEGLGLKADAVRAYITEQQPTYPEFESWVKRQPGVKLDKGTIYKLNSAIAAYLHDDATRSGILGANGISDNGSVNPSAIDLNNLEDWCEFHRTVLKSGE